jgi:type II secretory pathway pseudopilin PulG
MRVPGKAVKRAAPGGDGFTLVGLLIIIAIATIMLAAAFPLWTSVVQREKEEELIFRGEAYKEAIQEFFRTFGRPPQKLEELVEMEPRTIRKLYLDPMTEDGEWELVKASAQQMNPRSAVRRRRGPRSYSGQQDRQSGTDETQPLGTDTTDTSGSPSTVGGAGGSGTLSDIRYRLPGRASNVKLEGGFIIGVQSTSTETSIKIYNGATTYDTWDFTAQVQMGRNIPGAYGTGGGTWQRRSSNPGGIGYPGTNYPRTQTRGTYPGAGMTAGGYGTYPGTTGTGSPPYGYQGQQPYQTTPYGGYQQTPVVPRRPGFGGTLR